MNCGFVLSNFREGIGKRIRPEDVIEAFAIKKEQLENSLLSCKEANSVKVALSSSLPPTSIQSCDDLQAELDHATEAVSVLGDPKKKREYDLGFQVDECFSIRGRLFSQRTGIQ